MNLKPEKLDEAMLKYAKKHNIPVDKAKSLIKEAEADLVTRGDYSKTMTKRDSIQNPFFLFDLLNLWLISHIHKK